jgi:hypothetical protein
MRHDIFDGGQRSLGGLATGDGLIDERLVGLVGTTLWEATPEVRAVCA